MEELVIKYLAGEASRDETAQLLDWVASKPEHEAFYLEHKRIFDATLQRKKHESAIDIDHEWQHFLNNVERKDKKPEAVVVKFTPQRQTWLKVAAALLILTVSGFIVMRLINKSGATVYQTENERLAVTLPDGSHITLNDHSTLRLETSFGKETRAVSLSGEAYFDVARDKSRPFVITAANTTVEVVGTSFDILAYEKDNTVDVSVITGVVKFSSIDVGKDVRLTAGQKGIFTKSTSTLQSSTIVDRNFNAWNTRQLTFVENDLRSVINVLNKTYHTNVLIAADVPASCVVTVSFNDQTLDAVLHVLETTLNLTITRSGNKIEITHAGC